MNSQERLFPEKIDWDVSHEVPPHGRGPASRNSFEAT